MLIIVLGVWGGLIPFIGPYFHYSFGGDHTWHFTMQRLWLDILPGAVAVLGGFMLMTASSRIGGLTAGWIALIAGAWFAIGPAVALLWDQNIYAIGAPNGGSFRRMLEWVGYFHGLGVVIVGLSAFAMGRYFSRPRVAEEPAVVAADAAAAEAGTRRGTTTRAATADAPAERAPVTETRAAETRAAETRAAETRAAETPAERAAAPDAPVTEARAADAPVTEARAPDAPVTEARTADAPVTQARAADAPVTARPADTSTEAAPARATYAPTGATTATQTAPPRRRSGGLFGRFRRR